MANLTTADRIAMYVGGGLLLVGVFLIGLIEMALGSTHPVTNEGQVPHELLIDPQIRSYIMIAGLLIMGLYAIYRVVATTPATAAGT
jgi:hypothetical protein